MSRDRKIQLIIFIPITVLFLYLAAVRMPNVAERLSEMSAEPECAEPLDLKFFGFTGANAYKTLHCMGDEGRAYYRTIETRTDVLYPISYALFLALSIFLFGSYLQFKQWSLSIITALPVIAMCYDFYENYHIVQLIDYFPSLPERAVANAAFGNTVKWLTAFASIFFMVVLALAALVKLLRAQRT